MSEIKFAPKKIFDQTLEWFVIPTFDLIIEYKGGVIMVKRKIAPYNNQWALPGLRMYKGEEINDTLKRIAKQELGLRIDVNKIKLVGQYVGKFNTEHNRQDISTCYSLKINDIEKMQINKEHFTDYKITNKILPNTGAMYKYHLKKFWHK